MKTRYRQWALYPIALIWGMSVVITYAATVTYITGLIKKEPVITADLGIPVVAAVLAIGLFFVIRKLRETTEQLNQ